ncbi:uncharacterized protein LOC127800670 isoform X3 [Diospyros lotus]|uniref:uncharacterized protein LOC127800670 isoform X3 n=1 Tax=Diospyros lotus TaxID=55363 RepID=UPI0022580671|nr:uncharacterized protein LOC127800670 isoform X3 [Diospyros lotus]
MGDPLFELEQVLRSKQETLTSQEANVLMTCRARVVKDFIIGAAASGGLAWLVNPKLRNLTRIQISAGAAALSGTWRSIRSLESCLEHILSLDGSRMQKELANILVKRHGDNPKIAQFLSKRFYSEKVFDDYSIDQPRLRWRYRNFFSDNLSPQRTHGENTDEPKLASKNNPPMEALTDPLNCVFGLPGNSEEIHPTDNTSTTSLGRKGRSHRRSRRRHRTRHHVHEAS